MKFKIELLLGSSLTLELRTQIAKRSLVLIKNPKWSLLRLMNVPLQSIVRAHESMRPARVYLTAGELYDSSINRSPTAYELNPAEERALYDDDVDHEFTQLNILAADDGTPIGVINWWVYLARIQGNQTTKEVVP